VLDSGHIVQRGRHVELVEQDGLYRQLWELQNRVLLIEQIPYSDLSNE